MNALIDTSAAHEEGWDYHWTTPGTDQAESAAITLCAPLPVAGVRDPGYVFQGPCGMSMQTMTWAGIVKIEPSHGGMSCVPRSLDGA